MNKQDKELLNSYCQREGKRINTGEEKEIYMGAKKIITFFEKEESSTIKKD